MPDGILGAERRGGYIDTIDDTIIAGWAVDLTRPSNSAALLLLVDDEIVGSFSCTTARPDLNALGIPGSRLGFRFELPGIALDGEPHRIRIRFRSGEVLAHHRDGAKWDEVAVQYRAAQVRGRVDGLVGAIIRGWAFRDDRSSGKRTGRLVLEAKANGIALGLLRADMDRPDVAEAHGCEPHCGFAYTVPPRFRDGRPFEIEFRAVPEDVELEGSPCRGAVAIQSSVDRLFELYAKVEALCTQAYALKDELRQLVSTDEHTLSTYHGWAVTYYEALRGRLAAERRSARYGELLRAVRPKVSVVCAVYQPDLADFAAAVESVRRQSWTEWELILVDDGSRSAALTQLIDELCAADPRIRAVPHAENRGISAATNSAVAAATGEWIALFDHDDLLVDVALEVMLLAARNTGARLLYSDEDKVDPSGYFCEPHFKTDWNYRLLLTNNYVCHLLMVEAATLRAAGPLDPRYDGAQDHDLVLRLSELLDAAAIHHVPELLYHWRKTAGSTASAAAAKPYAVSAGRQAVCDHLERRGLPAMVEAVHGSTIYDVRWRFRAEPSVAILVPFKDQLELTRECVRRVLAMTAYAAYQVVLIDNWSIEADTLAWLSEIAAEARVRVVRREEAFNFSALNNRVAEQVDCDFLLFLNNDVHVQQAEWLRHLVNEALADPHVGIVGAKLLYPNQTVQHGGVVLGVGGIANHAFRGLPKDEPGYAGRAVCAQDMSAVTAACMLCRADAFRAVGMFDETHLAVAFNDVDLCLRIGRAGYRVVMAPAAVAIHHESVSRGSDFAAHHLPRFYGENQVMSDRWGALIRNDPYYNPHFSRETGMFDSLSTASLRVAHAPSLLAVPVARTRLPPGQRFAEPPPAPAVKPGRVARSQGAAPATHRRAKPETKRL